MTSEALLISRIGTALAGLAMTLFLITLLLTMQVENPVHPLVIVSLPALPTLVVAAIAILRYQKLAPETGIKMFRIAGAVAAAILVVATVVVIVRGGAVAAPLLLAVVGAQNTAGLLLASYYFRANRAAAASAAEPSETDETDRTN